MEKKSGVLTSLGIAAGAHLLQNKGLDFLLKTKRFSRVIGKRLTQPDGYVNNFVKATSNVFIPELRISENEARHFYKDIVRKMPYKEKVFMVNFLKGNWSKMANKPSQRKILKKTVSKVFPQLAPFVDKVPPSTIKSLEEVYKNDILGDNIIRLTRFVEKKMPKDYTPKYKKFQNLIETAEQGVIGKLEPSIPVLNGTKYFLAANVKKLKETRLGRTKIGNKALSALKKTQDKLNDWFVEKPIERTFDNALSDRKLDRLKNDIDVRLTIETQNSLVGRFRELETKLLSKLREKHPALTREIHTLSKNKDKAQEFFETKFNIRGLGPKKTKGS